MADKRLRLTVLTPAGALLEVPDVAWVHALLSDGGGVGIYPGHAPLLAETQMAALRYATDRGPQQTAALEAGILQVIGGHVLLLTGGQAAAPPAVALPADGEAERFDRLAGALLATLQADPAAVWGLDDTKET